MALVKLSPKPIRYETSKDGKSIPIYSGMDKSVVKAWFNAISRIQRGRYPWWNLEVKDTESSDLNAA